MFISDKQTPDQEILPEINRYHVRQMSQFKKNFNTYKIIHLNMSSKNTYESTKSAGNINTFEVCG